MSWIYQGTTEYLVYCMIDQGRLRPSRGKSQTNIQKQPEFHVLYCLVSSYGGSYSESFTSAGALFVYVGIILILSAIHEALLYIQLVASVGWSL
jgi:hypothetical protein